MLALSVGCKLCNLSKRNSITSFVVLQIQFFPIHHQYIKKISVYTNIFAQEYPMNFFSSCDCSILLNRMQDRSSRRQILAFNLCFGVVTCGWHVFMKFSALETKYYYTYDSYNSSLYLVYQSNASSIETRAL